MTETQTGMDGIKGIGNKALDELVALVTGAAGGIGGACVNAFLQAGARVIATDITDNGLSLPTSAGDRYRFLACDVSREDDVCALIDGTVKEFGGLDVLVNNAAVLAPTAALQDTTLGEFEKLMAVNVRGAFLCCKFAYPHLKAARGCIVNMSSMAGLYGEQEHAVYAATKGALNALTQSLAADWGRDGIRVNAVCPSSVETPNVTRMIDATPDPEAIVRLRQSINHLGFVASPAHIAGVVTFLASPAAAFITGALMPVSGGSECGYGLKY